MNINFPLESQIPQLRHLWKEAFHDTDEFLNLFFKTAFDPHRCRCVSENGEILAALYWFNCEYMDKPIAYIYGVATAKARRGQGICGKLMHDTHMHLTKLGYEGTLLVPGCEELFHFYQNNGYRLCSCIREFDCLAAPEEVTILPIDKTEYARLRKLLLPNGSVIQEKENLEFLQSQFTFYMGLGFILAAHVEKDILYGAELLGDISSAPGILHTLGYEKGTFRTPGHGKPFTMYYPLGNTALPVPNYFGFAFD